MASRLGLTVTFTRVMASTALGESSTPSNRNELSNERVPLRLTPPELVSRVPFAGIAPGASDERPWKFRPFKGRLATALDVMVVPTEGEVLSAPVSSTTV